MRDGEELIIRKSVTTTFAYHLADRFQTGKSTTYNGNKCKVTKAELSSDEKTIVFTLEKQPNFVPIKC